MIVLHSYTCFILREKEWIMKNKISLNLNFDYDSKTDNFKINASLSLDSTSDSSDVRIIDDCVQAIEYDDIEE